MSVDEIKLFPYDPRMVLEDLETWKERAGLTYNEMAFQLGVSPRTVHRIVNKERVGQGVLVALAEYVGRDERDYTHIPSSPVDTEGIEPTACGLEPISVDNRAQGMEVAAEDMRKMDYLHTGSTSSPLSLPPTEGGEPVLAPLSGEETTWIDYVFLGVELARDTAFVVLILCAAYTLIRIVG